MVHTTKMVKGKEIKTSYTRRGIFNVSKATQKELCKIFPNLLDLYDDNDGIETKSGAISVFDHWLNEEEYFRYVNSPNSIKESYSRKLDEFAFYMATNYECYTFKVVGRGKNAGCHLGILLIVILFQKLLSKNEKLFHLYFYIS